MSFASQATQQKFPFKYDEVFDGLLKVLPQIGISIDSSDRVIGRIVGNAGMSLFSWGENITLIIEKLEGDHTIVGIESSLKLGVNLAGAHRHQKNFNQIISELSKYLQNPITQTIEPEKPKVTCWSCSHYQRTGWSKYIDPSRGRCDFHNKAISSWDFCEKHSPKQEGA